VTAADAPERLAALHAEGFITPRPWTAAEIAGLIAQPGSLLITDAAGFALGRAVLDEAELLTVVVAAAARRHGLGRSLLTGFEAAARAKGASRGLLEVAADNAPALALYRRAGWQQIGRRPAYYRPPEGPRIDAVLMAKPL
jgi:[ribosomal protein S18]-alanine N-acetyltransferase